LNIRRATQAATERDVLFAIHFIRDRRSHAGACDLHFVQDLTLVGADRSEAAVVDHLEHKIARSS
jgi:hypothetical protein